MRPVLVLEDQELAREAVCAVLQAHQYECIAARTIHEALAWLEAGNLPCAVIVDLVMASDGVNFVELLRSNRTWAQVPVIVTTGLAMPAESGAAKVGVAADHYLLKPFDPDRLIDLLQDCCGLHPRAHGSPT